MKHYKRITINGKQILEHRHIIEKHYGPIPKGYVVNHINGIKNDNRLENLEVVTQSENCIHAWQTGLSKVPDYYAGLNLLFCPVKYCGYKTSERKFCFKHKTTRLVKKVSK